MARQRQDEDFDQRPPSEVVDAEFERKEGTTRSLVPTYDAPILASDYWVRKPIEIVRDLVEVEKRLMQEANLAGEDMFYAWGEGKDRVEGGSVILAMAIARCWGNCVVEQRPLQETRDAYVFTARFIDLETGFTYDRQFRQSKSWTVFGKFDAARKEDIRFNIGQSKAARNAILRSLPEYLKNKAIAKAKEGVRERLEVYIKANGIAAAQKLVLDALAREGVPLVRILEHYQIADSIALDVDKIVEMRGNLNAIQKGEEHADVIYPPSDSEKKPTADEEKKKQDDIDAIARSLAGNPTGTVPVVTTPKPEVAAETVVESPKPPRRDMNKIQLLKQHLSAAKDVAELDALWITFFDKHQLTEAEEIAGNAIYGDLATTLQKPKPPVSNGNGTKQPTLPAIETVIEISADALEFAKQFANSKTINGVNKTMERAGAQKFNATDMTFITKTGQARVKELETKE